jgi:general secretion pathway protein D
MNSLAMVQAGGIFRIVPAPSISHQPVDPISQTDPSKIPDDERLVLNLVFLRYASSAEMVKILQPFMGEGGQLTNYDPANLLIMLDNSRNMRRSLELLSMFDSDTFAGQRVRSFEVKNGRPRDISRELEQIFKSYALSPDQAHAAIRFLPIDRINTILAVAPNPGVFTEVEKWIAKLDIPAKIPAGSIQNNVYKLKYGRAEIVGAAIGQLYGVPVGSLGMGMNGGMYGGMPGNSSYPASGLGGGMGSGYGMGYGGGMGYGAQGYSGYGGGGGYGAYGSQYGGAMPYGGGGYGGGYNGGYNPYQAAPGGYAQQQPGATTSGPAGITSGAAATGANQTNPTDQTGEYLGSAGMPGRFGPMYPRIIPNPFDNTLLVQSTPEQWQEILHLLDQLDVAPRQVRIDAKIYEVDLTGDFSAGVETYLQRKGATNSAGITSTQLLGASNPSSSALSGSSPGINLTAGLLVGQSRQLLALLQANESTTRTKLIEAPSIIATDSIPASITVGESVPTLSSQGINPGVTAGGNSLFTNTIQNVSTGVGLTILARVNASGVVTMIINQNVTAPVATTTSAIESPSFSQRNVSTQVTVQDDDTIAIGGIITESRIDQSAGIPILHRIPYLGAAFGTKSYSNQRTELIVFLTPRVIYDTNETADASEELKEKLHKLRRMIRDE